MTAASSPSATLTDAHRDAIDAVSRWRGHCLNVFAKVERDCIEALEAMIASGRMPELKSPALFGARVESLRKGLESGHFDKAAGARKALDKLIDALARRNDIVHGVGEVWIDAEGDWLWRFSYLSNAKGHERIEGTLKCDEADRFERTLSAGARSLHDTLRNVAEAIADHAPTKPKS